MQLTQKHIINISVVAVLAILGYFAVQNNTPSQSDGVKVNTGSVAPMSQSDTGVETGTGKRLETVANSGTAWGISPFGSGKPLTEEEKKPGFKKPNTEWKTRTLQLADGRWMTYVFGQGNPAGVAQLSDKEKVSYSACERHETLSIISCGSMNEEVYGYLSSEMEKDLIVFISHPNWKSVLLNCEQQFRQYERPDWGMSYDQIMYQGAMNIENMITIDPDTGRKEIRFGTFPSIRGWFTNALREDKEIMGTDILKLDNCITQNGGFELYRLMDAIYQKQFYPL